MNGSINLRGGSWSRRGAMLLAIVLLAACGGGAAQFAGAPAPAGQDLSGEKTSGGNTTAGGDTSGGNQTTSQVLDAARPELLIVKTGTLDLQVEGVETAVAAAEAKITALGGYVSGSEQAGEGENVTASVTYRIPVAAWSQALEALRALAIKVVAEKTGTQDVTGQVVDLRARISNLQATEKALQAIMTQATKISDVLDVQAELTKVRGQIEEADAQRKHLEEQAAYSTLTARFSLKPEPAVVASQRNFDPQSEIDQASARLVDILQGVATAGIWFGIVWLPILIVGGVAAVVIAAIARRQFRGSWPRIGGPGPMPPPPPIEPSAPSTGG